MSRYPLEPDRTAMRDMTEAALELAVGFVEDLPHAPAVEFGSAERLVSELRRPPPEHGADPTALLHTFRQAANQSVDTAGPGYLAYIPGGGLFTSALAEFPARVMNRYTGFAGFAPVLVAMEDGVLAWLRDRFGLPSGGAGLTTTGGSLATLAALVAARTDRLGDEFGDGTMYVTAHTHRCVAKAARIAGLRAEAIRVVPTTRELRMDPAAAAELIAADRAAGRRPFLLVATAGTTDTGTVDPLPELADLARRRGLWFHVDAAYGGFFVLTERGRARLAGIEHADSLVLDPHKGMFLPYGTGVLLTRDGAALRAAHAADGHYLQDADGGVSGLPDYADLGPELTREFRGLRLWFPLQVHGVAAFREALDEKLDLAEAAHRELSADPLLELPWRPELSTVVLRLRGEQDAEARGRRLLERVNASRLVHLSSTRIAGRHHLRLCVLSHRTHAEHVSAAVEIIRRAARAEAERSRPPT